VQVTNFRKRENFAEFGKCHTAGLDVNIAER
jgi:hypothetical protein